MVDWRVVDPGTLKVDPMHELAGLVVGPQRLEARGFDELFEGQVGVVSPRRLVTPQVSVMGQGPFDRIPQDRAQRRTLGDESDGLVGKVTRQERHVAQHDQRQDD